MDKTKNKIGDIRVSEKNPKQREVLINTRSERAHGVLQDLQRAVAEVNERIPRLKKLGLADTIEDVIKNSSAPVDGLITHLAGKYVSEGTINDLSLAKILAKPKVESTLAFDWGEENGRWPDAEGLDWQPLYKGGWLLTKYKEYLDYSWDKITIKPLKGFAEQFEVWATGEAAERFIKFKEAVEVIDEVVKGTLPTADCITGWFKIQNSVALKDNKYKLEDFTK